MYSSILCIFDYKSTGFWYAPGFLYDVLNLYASVGGSSDCKLLVFLYLYVGGSNELQPRGTFLHLPLRWILQADCWCPPLSLSWSGSPKGSAEWSKWTAWTYAVSVLLYTQTGYRKAQCHILQLCCVFQCWFCAPEAQKGGSRGGSIPCALECYRLSQSHPSCAEQKWGNYGMKLRG